MQTEARAVQEQFMEEQRTLHQDMCDAYSGIITRVVNLELAAVEAEKVAVLVKEHEDHFVKLRAEIVAIQGVYLCACPCSLRSPTTNQTECSGVHICGALVLGIIDFDNSGDMELLRTQLVTMQAQQVADQAKQERVDKEVIVFVFSTNVASFA